MLSVRNGCEYRTQSMTAYVEYVVLKCFQLLLTALNVYILKMAAVIKAMNGRQSKTLTLQCKR